MEVKSESPIKIDQWATSTRGERWGGDRAQLLFLALEVTNRSLPGSHEKNAL